MTIQCQAFKWNEGLSTIPEMEVGWRISYHPKRSPSQVEDDIVSALWKHKGNTHLVTKNVSMIQVCLEKLLEAGLIEWQGSLRKTYLHYLSPDRLDLTSQEMFQHLNQGDVLGAFQFDSLSGEAILAKTKPQSLLEVATSNTLMRLMVEDEGLEQPSDLYVRYKANPKAWDEDMKAFGLNDKEINILKDHLSADYGVMNTQEQMMVMVMDERISNFDVVGANKLRKGVAKKLGSLYQAAEDKFYEDGLKNGCRQVFLDYIWNRQIAMQKGYGFSTNHVIAYSLILMQELNLFYHYPSIFWNTAVLEVESGSVEQETELEDKQTKEKGTNMGAMSSAIASLQQHGVKVALPHVNHAQIGFLPNVKRNEILFGLKGISRINLDTAKIIMDHRPYVSFQDFCERLVWTKREVKTAKGTSQQKAYITNAQVVSLIKAGAFDELENKPREVIMNDFLQTFFEGKKQLNASVLMEMTQQNLIPASLEEELKLFHFREFVRQLPKIKDEQSKTIQWATFQTNNPDLDVYAETFFTTHFMDELTEGRDYTYHETGCLQIALGTNRKGSFEAVMKQKLKPLSDWFLSEDGLSRYNKYLFHLHQQKHAKGTVSSWEMEVMGFYYHDHEVSLVPKDIHQLSDYQQLPPQPIIVGYNTYKTIQYPKYQLSRIVGCVLDRNTTKHTVSLLTETGVVKVKFQAGAFAHYDKTITALSETGEKIILEESWFKKGTLLILTGYRTETMFRPKVYQDTPFKHSVERIIDIRNKGEQVIIQQERAEAGY